MTARRAAFALAFLLAAASARSDGYVESPHRLTTLVGVTWEGGVPLTSMRGYADQLSYRGGQVEVRFGLVRHLSVGLATSWNWFSQTFPTRSVQYPSATVTGRAYDRVQLITLRATAHWYLTDGPVQPYLGAGIGAAWVSDYQSVSTLATSDSRFALTVDPQLGILVSVGRGLAIDVAARWHYTRARFAQVENANWAGLAVGVAAY